MLISLCILSVVANVASASEGCFPETKTEDAYMTVRMCDNHRVMKSCKTGYAIDGRKIDVCHEGHFMNEQSKCKSILSPLEWLHSESSGAEYPALDKDKTIINSSNEKLLSCSNKQRVRKAVSQMTDEEIEEFARTVRKVSTHKKFYQTWLKLKDLHHNIFDEIHRPGQFMAFLRYYLLEDENLLCHAYPNIVIPYWDFTCWSSNPWEAPLWRDDFMGGNGDPSHKWCVTTGPFSSNRWRLPNGECLKRQIQCPFPPPKAVEWIMQCEDFECFESRVIVTLHDQVHASVGGTIATRNFSSFAPEAELMHAFIDKIWVDWQRKMGSNAAQYPSNMDDLVAGTTYTIRQLLDSSNLPGGVSVIYEESECENRPTAGVCHSCESNGSEWLYTPFYEPLRSNRQLPESRRILYDSVLFINNKNEKTEVIKKMCGNNVMMSCPNGYMMDGPTMTTRHAHDDDQTSTCILIVQPGQGTIARGRGTQSEASLVSKAIFDTCPRSSRNYTFDTTCTVKNRLRKEVTTMTGAERQRYIDAVVELSTNATYKTKYRRLLDIHQEIGSLKDSWFAFNRWFLMEYENLLCEIDPKVTTPYWDSTCWSCNPMAAPIWGKDFLGGNGDPNQDYCVMDGPFARDKWSLPCNHCLKRELQCPFPPPEIVNQAMSCNDEACINMYMHSILHLQLHGHHGGTMTSQAAAYAPEYFLYHAYLDKLRDDWTRSRPDIDSVVDKNANIMKSQYKVQDMLDSRNLPGGISVTYQPYVCSGVPEVCRCTSCYSNRMMSYTPMFEPLLWFNVSESDMRALQESMIAMGKLNTWVSRKAK